MFDAISIFLIFIALLDFGLGFFVLLSARKNRANIFFGLFAFFLALWTITIIGFRISEEWSFAMAWMRAAYVAAIFIGLNFWYFANNFPTPRKLHPIVNLLNIVTPLIFSWFIWSTPILVKDVKYEVWGKAIDQGMLGWYLYAFCFLNYFLIGHLLLIFKYLKAKGLEKIQLRFVFSGVFLGGEVFGVLFNLFLPSPIFDEWRFIWVGPLLTTVFMLPIVGYAFVKHKLMNAKVITAQIFAILITFLAFINIFTYRNYSELILRIAIFVGILLSSAILIWGVIREVKRREEMERLKNELEAAYAKLKEIDQAKTDFLSMASHQLRSPLTVVRLGIGALLDGTFGNLPDKRQSDALNKMLESSTRLINLIGDYLNVSRIELGKMKYNFGEHDLCALVKDIVDEYQPRANAKHLSLRFDDLMIRQLDRATQDNLTKLKFDDEKLRHVIVNLIDNAIKYTMKGKIEVRCEVVSDAHSREIAASSDGHRSPRNDNQWVRVSIKDTGMGLEKADIEVLFKKFHRAVNSLRRRQGEPIEGSGLGLHVAKMFVDKHGGKIWAESEGYGKGSTFVFTLPLSGPPSLPADEMGEGGKGVEMPH